MKRQATVKLREEGTITQTTTIWNVLKKRETTGVLRSRRQTVRPRKTAADDDGDTVELNLQRAGVKGSHSTITEGFMKMQTTH